MKRLVLSIALLTAMAASAVALAAPDKTVQLSAASPEFKWDGVKGNYSYFYLSPVSPYDPNKCSQQSNSYCEQYLIDIRSDTPVKLDATLTEFSNPTADFDLYVYKSDASGKPGEAVKCGNGTGGGFGEDEICVAEELPAGHYLVIAVHFYNPNATYKGLVKITGATGDAPAPPASGDPAPPSGGDPGSGDPAPPASGDGGGFTTLPFKAAGTLGSAKKAKKKKAFAFKATSEADISNLVVALLDKKKKVVGRATVGEFKKGSRTLKLKVRKPRAGKYTLASQGVVDGRELKTAQAVKIKK